MSSNIHITRSLRIIWRTFSFCMYNTLDLETLMFNTGKHTWTIYGKIKNVFKTITSSHTYASWEIICSTYLSTVGYSAPGRTDDLSYEEEEGNLPFKLCNDGNYPSSVVEGIFIHSNLFTYLNYVDCHEMAWKCGVLVKMNTSKHWEKKYNA